jgi:hypothetical protein
VPDVADALVVHLGQRLQQVEGAAQVDDVPHVALDVDDRVVVKRLDGDGRRSGVRGLDRQ